MRAEWNWFHFLTLTDRNWSAAMTFRNREGAGKRLAKLLDEYAGKNAVVLGIPRGGVVVAAQVAAELGAPLDVVIPRKLGAPGQPELAIGAVAAGGDSVVLDERAVEYLGVTQEYLRREVARQREEIARRSKEYREGRPPVAVDGRPVIVVDDGIATGYTMLAAVRATKLRGPSAVIVAAPVAAMQSLEMLRREADAVVYVIAPTALLSVGSWYEQFEQTTDDEVKSLLAEHGELEHVG